MQSTKISPFTVWFDNSEEFHTLKKEIFTQGVYYTELENEEPVIIDAGAHIGLATLYFKKMYPKSKIWAIEPLKENFTILSKNIMENQLPDVELIQSALTDSGEQTTLFFDSTSQHWWSTAGRENGAWNHQQQSHSRVVTASQLSTLIKHIGKPIDLLKMDIEGFELPVLKEALPHLGNVKSLIIEFHPIKTQSLSQILTLLENSGFSYDLWKDGKSVLASKVSGLVYIQATKIR